MDIHPKKRKGKPSPLIRNTGPEPAATPAHTFFQTGDAGRIQPPDGTGIGSETFENYVNLVGASSELEDGKLPPSYDGVRSKTFPSGSCPAVAAAGSQVGAAVKLLPSIDPITERLNTTQTSAAGEPLNPDPVHFTTSPRLGGDSPVTSFTIPPTEEDLKQFQSGQDKDGYIKRPPNAFIVWSQIHRHKTCPGADMIDSSIALGREWSKLSEEQKRPYYEAAHKLKCMHSQQFPDYEYRPQKKKRVECLSSGQGEGQEPGISFSQAVPPDQSKLQGPNMYPYPTMMPYTVEHYPYPHVCQCHQMGPPLKITKCQQLHRGSEELPQQSGI